MIEKPITAAFIIGTLITSSALAEQLCDVSNARIVDNKVEISFSGDSPRRISIIDPEPKDSPDNLGSGNNNSATLKDNNSTILKSLTIPKTSLLFIHVNSIELCIVRYLTSQEKDGLTVEKYSTYENLPPLVQTMNLNLD